MAGEKRAKRGGFGWFLLVSREDKRQHHRRKRGRGALLDLFWAIHAQIKGEKEGERIISSHSPHSWTYPQLNPTDEDNFPKISRDLVPNLSTEICSLV